MKQRWCCCCIDCVICERLVMLWKRHAHYRDKGLVISIWANRRFGCFFYKGDLCGYWCSSATTSLPGSSSVRFSLLAQAPAYDFFFFLIVPPHDVILGLPSLKYQLGFCQILKRRLSFVCFLCIWLIVLELLGWCFCCNSWWVFCYALGLFGDLFEWWI